MKKEFKKFSPEMGQFNMDSQEYEIRINRKELKDGRTPILTYCREMVEKKLISDIAPTRLEIYGENDTPDVIVKDVRKASELTVKEDPSPHFDKYRPFVDGRIAFK